MHFYQLTWIDASAKHRFICSSKSVRSPADNALTGYADTYSAPVDVGAGGTRTGKSCVENKVEKSCARYLIQQLQRTRRCGGGGKGNEHGKSCVENKVENIHTATRMSDYPLVTAAI